MSETESQKPRKQEPDYYGAVDAINSAKAKLTQIIESARQNDPEFYEEIKAIFTKAKSDAEPPVLESVCAYCGTKTDIHLLGCLHAPRKFVDLRQVSQGRRSGDASVGGEVLPEFASLPEAPK